MLVSVRWLKKFLNFPLTIAELEDALTYSGIEVESALDLGLGGNPIVVGKIISVEPHPNAEQLSVCRVETGQSAPLPIVCGASNMQPGDLVPVALEGATLPNGIQIRRVKLRGVESRGMLCSGPELQYGHDASGLLILPANWKIGEPLDYLLDVSITPNRPDWLSVFGVAREVAAMQRKKITFSAPRVSEAITSVDGKAAVRVENPRGCPRYTARVIHNVRIGPSPAWLRVAVEAAGLRSINNVVDVTNYVLLELGHPLHAFDLDQLPDREVIVRSARDGEEIETLDGQRRRLLADDLLIASPAGAIALAGIMGGANSEITAQTRNVLLECACFDPAAIRRTARRLEVQTDSSYRFERGTDRGNLAPVINRAAQLIKEVAGGDVLRGIIDVTAPAPEPRIVHLDVQRVNARLGLKLSNAEMANTLVPLGFEIAYSDKEKLAVQVPGYRVDVEGEHDLTEEIARIYGYNTLAADLPRIPARPFTEDAVQQTADLLRDLLAGTGFHEVLNYSFIADADLRQLNLPANSCLRIANPLTQEQSVMRPSLIPGLLNATVRNHHRNQYDFALFEIGKVFRNQEGRLEPHEELQLVALLSGSTPPHWLAAARRFGFFDVKGVAERILSRLQIDEGQIVPCGDALFHPGQSARIERGGQTLLRFGALHPALARAWKLRRPVFLLEGGLEALTAARAARPRYREFARFPEITRDFAILVDEGVAAAAIAAIMRREAGELLEEIQLFDLFQGETIPPGKKSLAFTLTLRAADKTLTDDEANAVQTRIWNRLQSELHAALREN